MTYKSCRVLYVIVPINSSIFINKLELIGMLSCIIEMNFYKKKTSNKTFVLHTGLATLKSKGYPS